MTLAAEADRVRRCALPFDFRWNAGEGRKPVAHVTSIFLGIVALAQFLRLVFQVEVMAGGVRVPLWASAVAFVVTGGLAILLWRESRR